MKKAFYTMSPLAIAIFSFATIGLFNMYYYLINFHIQSEQENFDPVCVIKGILYPLFSLDLLRKAESSIENYSGIFVKVIFIAQLIFVFGATIFTGPFKFIGFFSFIPMLAVNKLFILANEANNAQKKSY